MSREPCRCGTRFLAAPASLALVAAACALGLATLIAVAPAGVAAAAPKGPRVSMQACANAKGELAWAQMVSQPSPGFGAPIYVDVTLLCVSAAGASVTAVTDAPVSFSVSPPGVVTLRPPAETTTDASGAAVAALVGTRAGTAQVRIEVSDGGACARDFSAAGCQVTVPVVISADGDLVSTSKTPTSPEQPTSPETPPIPPKADGILPPRYPAHNAPF
ncbi:MAG: hypothetical protein ACRDXC_11560, partial [Acidimicrobiales bacterium]